MTMLYFFFAFFLVAFFFIECLTSFPGKSNGVPVRTRYFFFFLAAFFFATDELTSFPSPALPSGQ
jgi:membrane-associated protease RseP (regulator of RpoE activity)